jgi:hypothetical protein
MSQAREQSFLIKREKQVSWFDTRQLLATGSQSLAATIVGSMSGRRELMAALEHASAKGFDYSDRDELWLDYIADTGDGWNATMSVAWLAGRDGLVLDPDGKPTPQPIPGDCYTEGMPDAADGQLLLPAGRVLVLGGDEVYPTASPDTYQHRFTDPMRCARWHEDGGRHLFSLPGNHDWYDGLTSFIRLFCQSEHGRRWFGGWQAQQRRSYFSVKLPHRWWLWGVDMALEDDLDPPQYDYFREQAQALESGDKLILSVPAPTWLKSGHVSGRSPTGRYLVGDKLDLIMGLARSETRNVDIPLVLTGDLHYYSRHVVKLRDGKRHYIVSGLGGAFGLGTLQVPPDITVTDKSGAPRTGTLEKTYPDTKASVKLRRGVLKFPLQNPAFTVALTAFQAISLWLLTAAAQNGWVNQVMDPELTFSRLCLLMAEASRAALREPALLLWLAILVLGFGAFANSGRPPERPRWMAWSAGIVHGVLQIVGTFICIWLAAQAIAYALTWGFGAQWDTFAKTIGDDWATLIVAAAISYFYCGFLFGAYLFLGHKALKLHDQEVFSSQAIEDYKGFLRMRFTREGLTIYPIGIRAHVAEWKEAPGVVLRTLSTGVFSKVQEVTVPPDCQRVMDPCQPLCAQLIEKPIVIPGADRK